jgi:hypothetical protein
MMYRASTASTAAVLLLDVRLLNAQALDVQVFSSTA